MSIKEFKLSLMKCPECGKGASTRDASCPHCGGPLSAEEIEVGTGLTGKRYRLYIVLGILICSLGWILFSSGDKSSVQPGVYFILVGLAVYIVAKVLIWWGRD
jgi:hypothetical protein